MTIAEQLQKFLKHKLDEQHLKRKDFIEGSGVSLTTTSQIFNADLRNPDFNTILKMAKYFNCSLDEVTGREDKASSSKTPNYQDLSSEQINKNLQSFINKKLEETGLNQYQLAKKLGFNRGIIYKFMQEHESPKKLGSTAMVALADYFHVSLDEMIGRTTATIQKTPNVEAEQKLPHAVQKLDPQDRESLQQIKQTVSNNKKAQLPEGKAMPSMQPKDSKDRTR